MSCLAWIKLYNLKKLLLLNAPMSLMEYCLISSRHVFIKHFISHFGSQTFDWKLKLRILNFKTSDKNRDFLNTIIGIEVE